MTSEGSSEPAYPHGLARAFVVGSHYAGNQRCFRQRVTSLALSSACTCLFEDSLMTLFLRDSSDIYPDRSLVCNVCISLFSSTSTSLCFTHNNFYFVLNPCFGRYCALYIRVAKCAFVYFTWLAFYQD